MMPMHNGSMPGMMMYFHFGISDTLLIEGWKAQNAGEFIASLVFFFIVAAMYEGLKYFREVLHTFAMEKRKERKGRTLTSKDVQKDDRETSPLIHTDTKIWRKITKMNAVEYALHMLQTFLHIVQVAVGYLLMLVVMTYNLWLFFAVVLGAGLGYLVFGRLRMVHAPQSPGTEDHCN